MLIAERMNINSVASRFDAHTGRSTNDRGLYLEEGLVRAINRRKNWDNFLNGNARLEIYTEGMTSRIFAVCMDLLSINPSDVQGVKAYQVGGYGRKTDIRVAFQLHNTGLKSINFSVKIASAISNFVTCHQYPVQDFIDELTYRSRSDTRKIIAQGLSEFAECGAWYGVKNIDQFLPCLQGRMKNLFEWAVAGKTVRSQTSSEVIQAIVLTQECHVPGRYKYEVFSVEDYRRRLFPRGWKSETRKGYPFYWTRHSKRQGDIVLKMPLVF